MTGKPRKHVGMAIAEMIFLTLGFLFIMLAAWLLRK